MISALAFVPRGVAKRHPEKFQMTDEEYQRICEMTQTHLSLAKSELAEEEGREEPIEETAAPEVEMEGVTELDEYKLDSYDNEGSTEPDIFSTMGSEPLSVFRDNTDDPYITVKDEDDEDEKEDLEILETDTLLLVGKTEDEISHLEVYVYDAQTDSLYIHHDIMLPSVPLCIEPINANMNDSRNWCAVATFDPTIELWNLDLLDAVHPHAILGGNPIPVSEEKKKKKKSKKVKVDGHSDAVLALSWNPHAQNFLLSSSADKSVILWDITNAKELRKFKHHTDKVSCVKWHPTKPSLFVSAGYDKQVFLVDAQLPEPVLFSVSLDSDIECLSWDVHATTDESSLGALVVGTDNGHVHYLKVCNDKFEPILSIASNSSSLTSVDVHPHIPGFLMTTAGESSNMLQIWDLYADATGQTFKANMICTKDTGAGKIFAGQICGDDAYLCAVGGSLGILSVWNITDTKAIVGRFHGRPGKSGVVNMNLESSLIANLSKSQPEPEVVDQEMAKEEEELTDDDDAMVETLEEMRGNAY